MKIWGYEYKGFYYSLDKLKIRLRKAIGKYYYYRNSSLGVNFLGECKFVGKPKFSLVYGSRITIGRNCRFLSGHTDNLIGINRPCIISTQTKEAEIIIGEGSGFSGTVIGAFTKITIGNDVKCGANTLITDSDWHPEDSRSGVPKPVVVGDNVWLGVNSVVLKGVTIGKNTVIGANSVVTKSLPPNVIAAGNPCKVIRELSSQKII